MTVNDDIATAAREFVDAWGYLMPSLGPDYDCTLQCREANAAAALFHAAGEPVLAVDILEMHSEDCDENEPHE